MKVKTQIKASVGPVGANHNEALRRASDFPAFTPTVLVGPSTTAHPSLTACTPPILVSPSTTAHPSFTACEPSSPGAPRMPCTPTMDK
jgi:hypothetical protein